MAIQWIDAATARSVIAALPDYRSERLAALAICNRAHSGILRSRAKLSVMGGVRRTDAEVPKFFWWAKGEAALKQNWASGDFLTYINKTTPCQTFGVTFAVDDLLDMLPANQRTGAARILSVAGSSDWVRASEAALLACRLPGVRNGRTFVIEEARLGLIESRAVMVQAYPINGSSNITWEEREWTIPSAYWQAVSNARDSGQDWDRGHFLAALESKDGLEIVETSGVHFLAEPLMPRKKEPSEETADSPKPPNTGGRPAQAWWDDLWCDIWGLIYEGSLIPKAQADVEKAMLEWAALHGHSPAESTIRPKARKLFAVFSGGVKNPPGT